MEQTSQTHIKEIEATIHEILTELLKGSGNVPDLDKSFVNLGINSLLSVEVVEELNKRLGIALGVEVMFDYQDVKGLAACIYNQYGTTYISRIEQKTSTETLSVDKSQLMASSEQQKQWIEERDTDVAIIGISGKFAGAQTIEEFWQHLQAGESCITEIRRKGWHEQSYYDPDPTQKNKSISKWGGFLEDIDKFDPLFFDISPLEAEHMDPQQRLFLEEAYKAFEDSGYAAEQLSGQKVGVFVGARSSDYKEKALLADEINSHLFLGNDMAILAARISYFLNFKGPSLTIDTACSSSLVAIHLACESIRTGESEVALAGGVFVLSSPEFYVMTSKTNMLSPDGKCKTFDNSANGIVIGEGVGAVILKRLKTALSAGDHIYGIVKGSAINQDGKTKGITAPSMLAQKALLADVYTRAEVHPETISYIEAHGTGTKLGDPIEFKALSEAFRLFTDKKQFCAIGSHKANFGHTIMTAGLAGVFKILMAMKYHQIPPTIQVQEVNQHIDVEQSPFFIPTQMQKWEHKDALPLRAGVSSFGFGGTNSHLILEEPPYPKNVATQPTRPYYLIPLAARTTAALQQKVRDLLTWLEKTENNYSIEDIAYTLANGRTHFPLRHAVVASNLAELQQNLKALLHIGSDKDSATIENDAHISKAALQEYSERLLTEPGIGRDGTPEAYKEKLLILANVYIKGCNLQWERIFAKGPHQRIPLPTYPFSGDTYWIPAREMPEIHATTFLHPFLQCNTSDLLTQRFTTTFTGQEFFLADHVVHGQRIWPGAASLEMARAAVELAAGALTPQAHVICLNNVVWPRPLIVSTAPVMLHIALVAKERGAIAFTIYSGTPTLDETSPIHCQGQAVLPAPPQTMRIDIPALQAQCHLGRISAEQCYTTLQARGVVYGSRLQGISQLFLGTNQILAQLTIPTDVPTSAAHYLLHPSLLDAALQATIGLALQSDKEQPLFIPFALAEITILATLPALAWVWIRRSEETSTHQLLNLDICDGDGQICVRLRGLSLRSATSTQDTTPAAEILLLAPSWMPLSLHELDPVDALPQQIIFLCEQAAQSIQHLHPFLPGARCLSLYSDDPSSAERFQHYALQVLQEIQRVQTSQPTHPVLFQLVVPAHAEQRLPAGLFSLLLTAQKEHPLLSGQLLVVSRTDDKEALVSLLKQAHLHPQVHSLHAREDGTMVAASWQELPVTDTAPLPWRHGGVYLITGGMGGLGRLLATEIGEQVRKARVILVGRSQLNREQQAILSSMQTENLRLEYRQVDVCEQQAVETLISEIVATYGCLNGIIHTAGVLHDSFILQKTQQELRAVLAPKTAGTLHLDEASKELPLDFFVLYSSLVGALGNEGKSDYATANAFLDHYASYRQELVRKGLRQGHTVSINWPFWHDGGMQTDAASLQAMHQSMGMTPMSTATGMQIFYQVLASDQSQVLVMSGNINRFKQLLFAPTRKQPRAKIVADHRVTRSSSGEAVLARLQTALKQLISRILKVRIEELDGETELHRYGFDSITFTVLANQINQAYQLDITPPIFFEHATLEHLTHYLYNTYRETLNNQLAPSTAEQSVSSSMPLFTPVHPTPRQLARLPQSSRTTHSLAPAAHATFDAIAIVGMSGLFPMAPDIPTLWANLLAGKDCISTIPQDRWNIPHANGDPTREARIIDVPWAGIVEGIDEFDPLFFGISPHEAELMDPLQRLLMLYVWKAIEDAGYSAQKLSGTNTGMFIGTTSSGYSNLITQAGRNIEGHTSIGQTPSMGPNRMSYFLNLHGPSEPIETACSSSLVAIHRAVNAITLGQCSLAIAGGVNLLIEPQLHISLDRAGMLSHDGHCKTFSTNANGFVRGEGAGMLFLKPLRQAEQDGDHIYGVIRATAENHGGRAQSLTAPNPRAQADLLVNAYRQAGIDPRTVGYIEAHGTGTKLGDPIEINGLKTAFNELYQESGDPHIYEAHCGLGSIKSNIGHLEVASGVAGVIKVLLQFQHRMLVKSLNCAPLNPYIQLEESPFYVVQNTRPWSAIHDEQGQPLPRRAGVSSFGIGGANAHIVLEEYIPEQGMANDALPLKPEQPALIVLSAKNDERLQEQVQQLLAFVQSGQCTEEQLGQLAYTLQVGRDAMEARLAMQVSSLGDLTDKLRRFLQGHEDGVDWYHEQVKQHKDTVALFALDEELQEAMYKWIERGKYKKVLEWWVKGLSIDWLVLYGETKPHRLSLPTYPFAKEHYWISSEHSLSAQSSGNKKSEAIPLPSYIQGVQQYMQAALIHTQVPVIATSEIQHNETRDTAAIDHAASVYEIGRRV